MNRIKFLLCLFSVSMLLSMPVAAAESDDYDANHDGKITFEEVMQKVEKSTRATFDTMDRNKDGVLSSDDFDDMREGMEKFEQWLDDLFKPFLQEDEPKERQV